MAKRLVLFLMIFEQIILAYGDEHTKLPDDLQRPAHWSKGDEVRR